MHSERINLVDARLGQILDILELRDPDGENSVFWAAQDLLDQAHEAASKLREQGSAHHQTMSETAV